MSNQLYCVGESSTPNANDTEPITSDIKVWKVGRLGYRNCARDYQESQGVPIFNLPCMTPCPHCQALLFSCESSELCCLSGKVKIPEFPQSSALLDLYSDQGEVGDHFRLNIRKYNHVFAFTSMGVVLDDELANARQGVYTFVLKAQFIIASVDFLPLNPDDLPRFLQMYIYDTEHENDHRMAENTSLRVDIIDRIKHILNEHNPFVHKLRHLAQRDDMHECKLVIKEQPPNQHNYSMPSASQVAAIVVGGDDIANLNDRDIMVESVTGQLMSIKDTAGYYDPLQYPLLFPYALMAGI
ncbi:Autophagic-related protein 16.1 [Bienertia sinuspersici]